MVPVLRPHDRLHVRDTLHGVAVAVGPVEAEGRTPVMDDEGDPLVHIKGLEQGVEVTAVLDEAIRAGATIRQLLRVAMPIRSGAMQRPSDCRCGNTLRQRYDEVGFPCSRTMGSPSPTSTYAISRPRIRRRCFWYGNAAEIPSTFWLAGAGSFGPGLLLLPRPGRAGMAP